MSQIPLQDLLAEIRACTHCKDALPLGSNPVVRASVTARLMIIGQAPGTHVHKTSIPWNDPSGDRLRRWLNLDREQFYDESLIAIMPMGFCYPGKGKSGDLPPRPECAPLWHQRLLELMPDLQLTLLIGQYSQGYYLNDSYKTLTERVRNWRECPSGLIPLPHPSPRNQLWLRRNPWFEEEVVPMLQKRVTELLTD
ncbi:uracil-DNA glycosylase family protein [Pontibacterium granulatum]|uniref:uracil-DNA glycosylase family protein n=1 Tax=Pontibacterium granulatum TaxID=2036029 RepID=UPI00249B3137|nr:uracil-DNA glycosylase family protein [Pontibacterium granulatum]MDI3326499.1 uracil-DNA glycosylase family protein [Pontibacterium granulatum]